jgi:hypothetical protein
VVSPAFVLHACRRANRADHAVSSVLKMSSQEKDKKEDRKAEYRASTRTSLSSLCIDTG